MRKVMLAAGSALAFAIAAPAFAQTQAVTSAAPRLPNVGVPAKGLPATPVVKPRVGHSNRPSVKVRAPVLRAGPASGRTLAQVTLEDATAADTLFSMLMGDQVAPRRDFIETHAKEVKFLDV